MKQFYAVVLERMASFSKDFNTEPYESGWAGEAIFFIRIHEIDGAKVTLESKVQISVDGIAWIDESSCFPILSKRGDYFVKVRHFGGWLRLKNVITGDNPNLKLTIHLVLKE